MNFEINLTFLIKSFPLHNQKFMIKTLISCKQKELLSHHLWKVSNEANDAIYFERWEPDFTFICEVFQNTSFLEYLCETAYLIYKLQNFNHHIQYKTISQVLFKYFMKEQEVTIRRW